MKVITLLWLLVGITVSLYSQTVTVTSRETGQPLELANLVSENPKAFAATDVKGQADISAFKDAEKIEIRLLGYAAEIRSYAELAQAGFTVSLRQSEISMHQVVVSATRWNQEKSEVPSKIVSIATRDIILQNPQTAADMLATSGEVFIQKSQQGGGSPMIRGFSTNRLLYAVDGVRMNTAIFRSGNLQNVISLDPFATEHTEVFFGPGSVIYGSDAIGGVMSFQTLTPQYSLSSEPLTNGNGVVRYSSANNEQTGHFDVNLGWKNFALVTSFSHFDFGDLRMGRNGPDEYLRPFYVKRHDTIDVVVANDEPLVQKPTGYSQMNLMQKLRFAPDPEWDLQFGFHYSETSNYSRYDRHIRYRNGLPRSAEWYYGPQIWMMNNLSITHNAETSIYDGMAVRLAHQFFEESRIDRDMNDPERRKRLEEVNAYSLNIDFNKSTGGHNRLFYGIEFVHNDVHSVGTDEDISTGTVNRGPARYPQSTWKSYGAYLTYQHYLTESVLMQSGARYNSFVLDGLFDTTFYPFPYTNANISNGALTGTLGFVFNPTKEWSISVNGSTGFRSPNVDDAGKVFDSAPGSVLVPNPDLRAEYVYNGEVGIARIINDMIKIDLTGYYTSLQDAMVKRDFTLNGLDSIMYDGTLSQVQAIQNAAVAKVHGVQFGVEVKHPSGFGFSSRFNYQKGEEELDDGTTSPSRHAAPWFGATHLTYSTKNLLLDYYALYSGEVSYDNLSEEGRGTPYIFAVDRNGNPYSPAWYTLNVKATASITNNFSVSSGIENLTDQRYRTYSSGIAAAGRNFVLSLKATM